jgi:hypothetical protein
VFVVFRDGGREDHLVSIGKLPAAAVADAKASPAGPAVEVLAMDAGTVKARVWKPGTYVFETARGRGGKLVVDQVPADQVIKGPWTLRFPEGWGAPPAVTMPDLTDWTESPDAGVRYFSGTASYHNRFVLPDALARAGGPVFLDLGSVKEVAVVTVNGNEAGVLWMHPYRIDIGPFVRAGENQLAISVTNLWNNRIVGDLRMEPGKAFTRTNLKAKFSAKSPLLSSGLIGPVTLDFPAQSTIKLEK